MVARAWLLALAAVAVCRVAQADEPVPIHVELAAPETCPTKADFVNGVLGRTTRAAGQTFVVTVTLGRAEARGHLVIRTPDGAESERDITGDTCAEVVDALALIAALAIDPHASTTTAPPPEEEKVVEEPPPLALVPIDPVVTPPPRETPAPPPRVRRRWRFGASAGGSVAGGVAPSSLFGVPVSLHAVAPLGGAFAPSLHLAFERTSSGSIDVTGGAATFTWTVASFEGCPHRWAFGARDAFEVAPCVRFEGGAVEGQGSHIVPARADTHPWIAVGAVGRAEWTFAGPFFVELDAGARAPFVRTTYFFQPDTTIYRAPVVGAIADLGVGARFL